MTQELITELREWRIASAPYEPEYKVPPSDLHLKAADALERMEAENAALKEGLDGWHARYLDAEVERDALRAGLDAALDFAGTVAGGASWWDDVWKEHEAAIAGEKT